MIVEHRFYQVVHLFRDHNFERGVTFFVGGVVISAFHFLQHLLFSVAFAGEHSIDQTVQNDTDTVDIARGGHLLPSKHFG